MESYQILLISFLFLLFGVFCYLKAESSKTIQILDTAKDLRKELTQQQQLFNQHKVRIDLRINDLAKFQMKLKTNFEILQQNDQLRIDQMKEMRRKNNLLKDKMIPHKLEVKWVDEPNKKLASFSAKGHKEFKKKLAVVGEQLQAFDQIKGFKKEDNPYGRTT